MNRRSNPIPPTAALLALLLACLLIPLTALAATSLGNDNHTDTDDYCLRAHDVRIGLSEFSTRTRTQLEADIVSASAFEFYYRSDWSSVTSGYSVDFSSLVDAVSSTGYPVTVTLDPVSMSVSSYVTFPCSRGRHADPDALLSRDVPVISATPGSTCPGFSPSCPQIRSQDRRNRRAPFLMDAVARRRGRVTFSGWTARRSVRHRPGVAFTGYWIWTALRVFVEYVFVSSSSGRALPVQSARSAARRLVRRGGGCIHRAGSCHRRIGGGVCALRAERRRLTIRTEISR